jgi:LacI family transcriptional regulator
LPTVAAIAPTASRILLYIQAEYRCESGGVEGVTRGIAGAMFEGAATEASRSDYDLVHRTTTAAELRSTVERLVQRHRAAGVVAASFAEEKALRRLGHRALPVVLLDHDSALPKTSSVREDSAAGSRLAVEHLVSLGHRRIALAQWHRADLNPWRERGFREALRAARITARRRYEIPVEITPQGAAALVETLQSLDPRPTALVAFNNTLARYIVDAATAAGLRVPEDLSVVGCGGEEVLGLTTCRTDWHELGRAAVELLLHQIDAKQGRAAIEHRQPPPTLRQGDSSAPPPAMP